MIGDAARAMRPDVVCGLAGEAPGGKAFKAEVEGGEGVNVGLEGGLAAKSKGGRVVTIELVAELLAEDREGGNKVWGASVEGSGRLRHQRGRRV